MNYEAMDDISAGASTVSSIISLIIFALTIIAWWRIFVKAGEPGWKSIIPIYDVYMIYKIVWGKGWVFLLLFIPVVNIVVHIMLQWKLSKAFDKGVGFFILLLFLNPIGMIILAFDSSRYIGPQ